MTEFKPIDYLKGLPDISPEEALKHGPSEKILHDLITYVLKAEKLRYHEKKKERDAGGCLFRFSVEANQTSYVLKSYLVYDTGYFSLTFWSADERHLEHVATLGYLKNHLIARGIAKERLKQWLKKK